MVIAIGAAGAAVPAVAVEIPNGVLARLDCVNVKGPSKPPMVVFCTLMIGVFVLVMVHAMFEPAAVAAESRVIVPATRFDTADPPEPRPVQTEDSIT
jgi:hypothetical protein